jgi:hypothetical protein
MRFASTTTDSNESGLQPGAYFFACYLANTTPQMSCVTAVIICGDIDQESAAPQAPEKLTRVVMVC